MPARQTTNGSRLKGRQLLRRLRRRFPVLFPRAHKDLKPWAVGESARLRQALAEDGETVSGRVWRLAIQGWFHGDLRRRIAYLECLTEGAPRYDRHGDLSGAVSEEEAAQAAAELPRHQKQLAARLGAAGRPQARTGKVKTAESAAADKPTTT